MKAPTTKQINTEIKTLEELKPKLPRGMMGDNRASVDAQIAVLKDGLNNDKIFDRWPDDERDCDIRTNALDAMDWRDGRKEEKPSDGWQELVR